MRRVEKGEGFPGQRIVVLPGSVVARARRQPLLEGVLPTDAGYFPNAAGHYRQRPQGAGQFIFIHCSRGAGWCEIDSRRHSLTAGSLLVLPPQVPHAYGTEDTAPWTIHWFHALGALVPHFARELGVDIANPTLPLGNDVAMLGLFDDVLTALEHGYTEPQLVYAAHVVGHLLARIAWLRHRGGRRHLEPAEQIARSIEFMHQHLDRHLRLGDLAGLAGLSPSHYGALFKQRTGYAPLDYFIRLRMHRACQLLDTTSLPVKAVAAAVGYEDPLYFSRAFRAVVDLPPTAYRNIRKG